MGNGVCVCVCVWVCGCVGVDKGRVSVDVRGGRYIAECARGFVCWCFVNMDMCGLLEGGMWVCVAGGYICRWVLGCVCCCFKS